MKLAAVLLAFVAAVSAQSTTASGAAPTSTGGIPPCVLACSQQASTVAGCSFLDTSCSCLNAQFQASANACLGANCSAADAAAGLALQNATCAGIASALPISGTVAAGNSSASASGASQTGSSSSASTSSAASASGSSASGSSSSASGSSSSASAAASTTKSAGVAVGVNVPGLVGAVVAVAGMGLGALLLV